MSSKDVVELEKTAAANALQTGDIYPQQMSQFVIKDLLLIDIVMKCLACPIYQEQKSKILSPTTDDIRRP